MTRTEFIKSYAARSELSDRWAVLGFIDIDGCQLVAMPCACDEEGCEGWAMLPPSGISSHLSLHAPENLRRAYREALADDHIF